MGTPQDGAEHDGAWLSEKNRDDALEVLRWNWGTAYMIGQDEEHGWWAARRDQIGGLMTAGNPGALRADIWADYSLLPVPHESTGDAGGVVHGTDPGALVGDQP